MTVHVNRVIHSKRRTIALIVEYDGSLTVRAPARLSGKAIQEFVDGHAGWVEKKQAEIRSTASMGAKQYESGESFPYLGHAYPLEIASDTKRNLVLTDHFKLAESARENAEQVFQSWYRQQAGKIIKERVMFFAEKFQLHYEKVRITSACTRWGSCSSKGSLSFSWRLVTTPLDVIDYVIIHELAHTIHHNHSKQFWNLVEQLLPDYKERRRQLKQYGGNLNLG